MERLADGSPLLKQPMSVNLIVVWLPQFIHFRTLLPVSKSLPSGLHEWDGVAADAWWRAAAAAAASLRGTWADSVSRTNPAVVPAPSQCAFFFFSSPSFHLILLMAPFCPSGINNGQTIGWELSIWIWGDWRTRSGGERWRGEVLHFHVQRKLFCCEDANHWTYIWSNSSWFKSKFSFIPAVDTSLCFQSILSCLFSIPQFSLFNNGFVGKQRLCSTETLKHANIYIYSMLIPIPRSIWLGTKLRSWWWWWAHVRSSCSSEPEDLESWRVYFQLFFFRPLLNSVMWNSNLKTCHTDSIKKLFFFNPDAYHALANHLSFYNNELTSCKPNAHRFECNYYFNLNVETEQVQKVYSFFIGGEKK